MRFPGSDGARCACPRIPKKTTKPNGILIISTPFRGESNEPLVRLDGEKVRPGKVENWKSAPQTWQKQILSGPPKASKSSPNQLFYKGSVSVFCVLRKQVFS